MKTWFIAVPLLGTLAFMVPSATVQANAQTVTPPVCSPLQILGTNGTQIQKKVSLPGTPTSRSNWNTDFLAAGNQPFRSYIATIQPMNQGQYHVQMHLKYANGTADKVFDQSVKLPQTKEFRIAGSPRLNESPYQVNLSVGGIRAVGNTYKVSVFGCN
jgi:hypothetical protein